MYSFSDLQKAISDLPKEGGRISLPPFTIDFGSEKLVINKRVKFVGEGWNEAPDENGNYGSVLKGIGNFITVEGIEARGTIFEDLAIEQVILYENSQPIDQDYALKFLNTFGAIKISNVFFRNCFNGTYIYGCGRAMIDIFGFSMNNLVFIDKALDVPYINKIHCWPFVDTAQDVAITTQVMEKSTALKIGRVDGFHMGSLFCFGPKYGIRFEQTPDGTSRFWKIDNFYADFCKYPLVLGGDGIIGTIDTLNTHCENPLTKNGTPIAGSVPITIIGNNCELTIGDMHHDMVDSTVVNNTGKNIVNIGFTNIKDVNKYSIGDGILNCRDIPTKSKGFWARLIAIFTG